MKHIRFKMSEMRDERESETPRVTRNKFFLFLDWKKRREKNVSHQMKSFASRM